MYVVEDLGVKILASSWIPQQIPDPDEGYLYTWLIKPYFFGAKEISKWIVNKIELGIVSEETILKNLRII